MRAPRSSWHSTSNASKGCLVAGYSRWRAAPPLAFALALLSTLLFPSPSFALPCAAGHCYDVLQYQGTSSSQAYDGMRTYVNFAQMTPGVNSGSYFINSEMWVSASTSSQNWVEVGITRGRVGGNSFQYQTFAADFVQVANPQYREVSIAPGSPDGSLHWFQITRAPGQTNRWDILQDGSVVVVSRTVGWWHLKRMDVGAELYSNSSLASASTFNMQTYAILNNQLLTFPANNLSIDFACPQTGCFNANWTPAASTFSWNKTVG